MGGKKKDKLRCSVLSRSPSITSQHSTWKVAVLCARKANDNSFKKTNAKLRHIF